MAKSNRNSRRRRGGGRRRMNRSVKVAFNGTTRRAGPDPRGTVSIPWNTVVVYGSVVTTAPGNFTVAPTDVTNLMAAQGIIPSNTNSANVNLRIQRMNLWNEAGNAIVFETRDINDVNTASAANISTFWSGSDYPGRNHWAHIGYEWPRAQQTIALKGNNAIPFAAATSVGSTFYKIYVLWRYFSLITASRFESALTITTLPRESSQDSPQNHKGVDWDAEYRSYAWGKNEEHQ